MIKKVLFFGVYFLSPVLPIIAIYNSNPGYFGASGFLQMILGSVSFTWLNIQLILSARVKLIEASFSLDRLYRFHGIMAIVAIILALIHKLKLEEVFDESFQTKLGSIAILIFIAASALALVFMIDTVVAFIKPLKIICEFAKKLEIGKYNIQLFLHNLNVAAVVLIFIHVMLTNAAKNSFAKSVFILYFVVSIGFYFYFKIIRRYIISKKFMIERVTAESKLMWTLTLKPENGEVFSYLPGQFGFLRIKDKNVTSEEHPFSFSSDPSNKEFITVTIKNLGDWTACVGAVKAGSKVALDGPYGKFSPLLFNCENGMVLIAGGVGITPMLSILRYYRQHNKGQKIMLFWGVNDRSDLISADEINAMQQEMGNFSFIPVMMKDDNFEGEKGYINEEKLERFIKANGHDLMNLEYFICGPSVMQKSVLKNLKALGIGKRHIHYESFSL